MWVELSVSQGWRQRSRQDDLVGGGWVFFFLGGSRQVRGLQLGFNLGLGGGVSESQRSFVFCFLGWVFQIGFWYSCSGLFLFVFGVGVVGGVYLLLIRLRWSRFGFGEMVIMQVFFSGKLFYRIVFFWKWEQKGLGDMGLGGCF